MDKINFTKMQGAGNDFIVIEDLENKYDNLSAIAKKLCDRNFGIGGDGILVVKKSVIADIQMIIINIDGSYAAMCGNGIRCFAKYVWEKKLVSNSNNIKIETGDGIKEAFLDIKDNEVKKVTINMGNFSFKPKDIPALCDEEIVNKEVNINDKNYSVTSMLMGVPHTIIFGKLDDIDINEGKFIEKYRLFPSGTNVNFCEIINEHRIKVKTWERGAGPTLACGTGCCASVVAAHKLGFMNNKTYVEVPGGVLEIEIEKEGVIMTGPAEVSFEGICKL